MLRQRPFNELARRLHAGVERLATTRAQRVTLLVATLLGATSVGPHRALDDYVLALIATGRGGPVGLPRHELDLFTFTTGDVAGNRRLMDVGLMLPWWTDPNLKISFFRPISSATHWLDERLWPSSAALMHLHSLAWFAVLLAAAAAVYRRFEASALTAGLAFFLFAMDPAHGPPLSWLANRNALIATVFGLAAIALHDAGRRGARAASIAAPFAFLAGLLAGELAIGALAYLVAYAFVLDGDRASRRVASLVPYLGVVGVWRAAWSRGGFGARASGAYLDPLRDPIAFLRVLPEKFVVLLHGQFSAPPSDVAFLGPPTHRPIIFALALLTCGVVGWLLSPVVRTDKTARFWALGMVLALVPLGATFPSDRLLMFVGLGAAALLARLFLPWLASAAAGTLTFDGRATATGALLLLHLVAAPLLLATRSAQMELFAFAHDQGSSGIPAGPAVATKTVVVLAAPTVLFANYIQAQRALAGTPRPAHLYVLAGASSAIDVERTGPRTLTLRPEHGFLYTPLEQHYRGAATMDVGDRVTLSGMTAEVVSRGGDGRPAAVEFSFTAQEADTVFVAWSHAERRFVPFALPALGEHVTLPEEDFGKILVADAAAAI